ncbi:hypothetical protein CRG98_028133 [Punica granatum]|uniref:Uncharacterized protein n=1 Tax=Punica granatum TaxID=22663 RepID=A0A2I0J5B4_PUNGR|nr:hypothetical protein CRG98_028133 [Punica granatum]
MERFEGMQDLLERAASFEKLMANGPRRRRLRLIPQADGKEWWTLQVSRPLIRSPATVRLVQGSIGVGVGLYLALIHGLGHASRLAPTRTGRRPDLIRHAHLDSTVFYTPDLTGKAPILQQNSGVALAPPPYLPNLLLSFSSPVAASPLRQYCPSSVAAPPPITIRTMIPASPLFFPLV